MDPGMDNTPINEETIYEGAVVEDVVENESVEPEEEDECRVCRGPAEEG